MPLAADSLGVRSMATYVEVGETGILIDPGATLAPSRFNLPPADEEWEALRRANDRISAYAGRAAFVFVSHYHEDHFRSDPVSYAGRTVLLKDPRRMVGGLQARRAAELVAALTPHARVEMADGYERRESALQLRVSPPLAHGVEGTAFGYLVALTVVDPAQRERFVFASDVQGPLSPVAAAYLIQERPTLLYLSGPPSYVEREIGAAAIERGIDHLLRVLDVTGCRVVMDHHAVRDAAADTRFQRLWETGRVGTAAAFLGLPEARLEAQRAQLWARTRKPAAKSPAGT
ncbi:MAG: hypothetical protein ACREJG_12750, partial [Candidatus Rokuibacteriota bacterium]